MQIGSLFMALGFDVDSKKLDDFTNKVGVLKGGLVGIAGTAAAGVGALTAMTLKASDTALSLSNINLLTGQTTESIQRLASVASGTNPLLGMAEAAQMIAGVFDTIVDAEWGEGATGALAQLGITSVAQKSVEDLIMEARRVWNEDMAGISQGRKVRMFEEARIPNQLINMIAAPQDEFERFYNRDIPINNDDIEKLTQINKELAEISYNYSIISGKLGSLFADTAMDYFIDPVKWFSEQNLKIVQGLEALANGEPNPNLPVLDIVQEAARSPKIEEYVQMGNTTSAEREDILRDWLKTREQTNINTTNNFNIETNAEGRDIAESLYDLLDEQQNRGVIGEFPNSANGGFR